MDLFLNLYLAIHLINSELLYDPGLSYSLYHEGLLSLFLGSLKHSYFARMALLLHTRQMCVGRGVFVSGTMGPAPATTPIFIIASIIFLFCVRMPTVMFCVRMSEVCFLCAKSLAFKASTAASVLVVVCILAAYSFNSAIDCSSPFTYSLYSAMVSAVVLTLLAPVVMSIIPGYVVCGLVVASLILAALWNPLLTDWFWEYAFWSV